MSKHAKLICFVSGVCLLLCIVCGYYYLRRVARLSQLVTSVRHSDVTWMSYDGSRKAFVAHVAKLNGARPQRVLFIARRDGHVRQRELYGDYVRGQFCIMEGGRILGIRRIDAAEWGLVEVGDGERDICVLRTMTDQEGSAQIHPILTRYVDGELVVLWSDGVGSRVDCITGEVSPLTGIEFPNNRCSMVFVRGACIQSLPGVINIWSMHGGAYVLKKKCPFTLGGRPRFAALDVAEDATSVFACDVGRVCRIDVETCECLWDSDIPIAYPGSMRLSSGGKFIGVGGLTGEISVLSASNGSLLYTLRHGEREVPHVTISPEGTFVAAVSTDGNVRGWCDGKEVWLVDTESRKGKGKGVRTH